jgi:hypothetical protein
MKFFYFLMLILTLTSCKSNRIWTSFQSEDLTLIGFKDSSGKVKIKPKFINYFTIARKFDRIISVMEKKNGKYEKYYLLKSKKIVGKNKVYITGYEVADCESEGFIRFTDTITQKIGLLNKKGKVVIPAQYNTLTKVKNGLVIGLKDAKKEYWDKQKYPNDTPFNWVGGKRQLLSTSNKILIDNFDSKDDLNFFSLKIESKFTSDSLRHSFRGVNGKYYSFIDYKKEFNKWISLHFNNLTVKNLIDISHETITYWKEHKGWVSEPKKDFLTANFNLIKARLVETNREKKGYPFFIEGLNPLIFNDELYGKYIDNCDKARVSKYPLMNVSIYNKVRNNLIQDHFYFLRTDQGYKLITISITDGILK